MSHQEGFLADVHQAVHDKLQIPLIPVLAKIVTDYTISPLSNLTFEEIKKPETYVGHYSDLLRIRTLYPQIKSKIEELQIPELATLIADYVCSQKVTICCNDFDSIVVLENNTILPMSLLPLDNVRFTETHDFLVFEYTFLMKQLDYNVELNLLPIVGLFGGV